MGYLSNVGRDRSSRDRDLSHHLFIPRTVTVTMGHPLRLEERRFVHKHRRGFFTVRAVRLWNSLPEEVVMVNQKSSRGAWMYFWSVIILQVIATRDGSLIQGVILIALSLIHI